MTINVPTCDISGIEYTDILYYIFNFIFLQLLRYQ